MNGIKNDDTLNETKQQQEQTGAPDVSYIVYESAQARAERTVKRLIGVIVLLIALLATTNMFWLYEWMQYDYVSETVTVDQDTQSGNSNNNYIGNDGDIRVIYKKI